MLLYPFLGDWECC